MKSTKKELHAYNTFHDIKQHKQEKIIAEKMNQIKQCISKIRITIALVIILYLIFIILGDIDYLASNPLDYRNNIVKYILNMVTHIFIHKDLGHLLYNIVPLFIIGVFIETRIGSWKFLTIFIIAGIVGGFAATITSLSIEDYNNGRGASGAMYGVVGAAIVLLRSSILENKGKSLQYFIPLLFIILVIILLEVYPLIPSTVSFLLNGKITTANTDHLVGFLTGMFLGLFFIWKK